MVTGLVVGVAVLIKRHYNQTARDLRRLDELVGAVELSPRAVQDGSSRPIPPPERTAKTAVVLVNGFNGLGLHTLLTLLRMFPSVFKHFIFVQIGVADAGNLQRRRGGRESQKTHPD